jgi:hypothetical protein
MSQELTEAQELRLHEAARIISAERADAIVQLKHWTNGMCLNVGNKKPDVPEPSLKEEQAICTLWGTLPGHTSWMDALYFLRNHSRERKEELS